MSTFSLHMNVCLYPAFHTHVKHFRINLEKSICIVWLSICSLVTQICYFVVFSWSAQILKLPVRRSNVYVWHL